MIASKLFVEAEKKFKEHAKLIKMDANSVDEIEQENLTESHFDDLISILRDNTVALASKTAFTKNKK